MFSIFALKERSADQIKININQKIDYFNQAPNTTHDSCLKKDHMLNIVTQHLILILYRSQLQNDMKNRFYNSVAA